MKSRTDQKVVFAFALAVGVFIAIGLLSFINTQESHNSQQALSISHKKIELLQKTLSDVKDIEIIHRNYVLTGHSDYLLPLDEAIRQCRINLEELRDLAHQQPDPILTDQRLAELSMIIERKSKWAKDCCRVRQQQGVRAAVRMLSSGQGKLLMEDVQREIAGIDMPQRRLQERRFHAAQENAQRTLRMVGIGTFLATILLIASLLVLQRDVVERQESAAALQESEARFRLLAENSFDMIARYTVNGQCVYISPSCRALLGYKPEEMIGRTVFAFIHPDDLEGVLRFHANLPNLPSTYSLTNRVRHRNGHYIWLENNGRTIRDPENNQIIEVQVSSRDVTARRDAEEKLRLSEERYRELIENSIDLIYKTDAYGHFTFFNSTATKLTQYSHDELLGRSYLSLIHPDYREATERFYGRQLVRRYPNSYHEFPMVRKDGEIIWLGQNVRLVIENGEVQGFEAVARDITDRQQAEMQLLRTNRELEAEIAERKQVEIALRDSESRFRAFMNNSQTIAFMKNADGRYVYVNGPIQKRFNRKEADWLGKTDEELGGAERARTARESDLQVLATNEPMTYTQVTQGQDGKNTYWLMFKFPLEDAGGQRYLAGIGIDITERKIAEEGLKQTTAELQRSNAELEQFAYVASHDLQEPLRMVVSYLQLIERRYTDKLDDDAHEFIDYAVDGAVRMQKLINDLLDYSRVGTRGKAFELIDMKKVIENALSNLEVAIRESEAGVTYGEMPQVMGDASQLTRLLQNLIINAIKFRGEATPRVHIEAELANREWLFRVRDNGIGIAEEHRERIFAVFQRLHSREEYPGTGIGLAVSKKIVERHGGRIWVEANTKQMAHALSGRNETEWNQNGHGQGTMNGISKIEEPGSSGSVFCFTIPETPAS